MTTKLVIFRIPATDEGIQQFVQVKFNDGVLDTEGEQFYVEDEADSYNSLNFSQIVIADETEYGSVNAVTFSVADADEKLAVVYTLSHEVLTTIVTSMINDVVKQH